MKNISKNEDEDNAATTTPKLQLIKFHRQILPRISHSYKSQNKVKPVQQHSIYYQHSQLLHFNQEKKFDYK